MDGLAGELIAISGICPLVRLAKRDRGSRAVLDLRDGTTFIFPVGDFRLAWGQLCVAVLDTSGRVGSLGGGGVTWLAGNRCRTGCIDGTGADALFNKPMGVAVNGNGDIYVADTGNASIRRVQQNGTVSSPFPHLKFAKPMGVALATNGDVIVADAHLNQVRRITPCGEVIMVAGSGLSGYLDGGKKSAEFSSPCGVAVDGNDTIYVADYGNMKIRKIDINGHVSTVPTTGDSFFPVAIAIDFTTDVLLVTTQDSQILRVQLGYRLTTPSTWVSESQQTAYDILKVSANADTETIRQACKTDLGSNATLQRCCTLLMNDSAKRAYDRSLDLCRSNSPTVSIHGRLMHGTYGRMRYACRRAGLPFTAQMPPVVILGMQGSEKTHILQRLIGRNVLTPCVAHATHLLPTVVRTTHSLFQHQWTESLYDHQTHLLDRHSCPMLDVPTVSDGIINAISDLSRDELLDHQLTLDIHAPDVVDLAITELPGLLHYPFETARKLEQLAQLHMTGHQGVIVVCVVSAHAGSAQASPAIAGVMRAHASNRCIVVVTNADELDAQAWLAWQRDCAEMNFQCVVPVLNHVSGGIEEALGDEEGFFASWTAASDRPVGLHGLLDVLAASLEAHLSSAWATEQIPLIKGCIDCTTSAITALGSNPSNLRHSDVLEQVKQSVRSVIGSIDRTLNPSSAVSSNEQVAFAPGVYHPLFEEFVRDVLCTTCEISRQFGETLANRARVVKQIYRTYTSIEWWQAFWRAVVDVAMRDATLPVRLSRFPAVADALIEAVANGPDLVAAVRDMSSDAGVFSATVTALAGLSADWKAVSQSALAVLWGMMTEHVLQPIVAALTAEHLPAELFESDEARTERECLVGALAHHQSFLVDLEMLTGVQSAD